ncbi:PRTRC system ParB family protein [Xanthomonas hortorum]|uniref:PRTRC system ParB family protein n=1 Tax=Xanthomonas hortorum pv. hederae TaxID=453603 RepID=A0A9X4H698_9XANT|nr:PRTRC system ParB family protein [Xanthomonas hortorum]MCE4369727.1 PRTRC system ParB family protein [Xanthomonas hortorum pv. hederae]MDC8638742.1 PRTRC system ParB family protein [Xanthomonas hortorum pv. hederae]PPU86261.1 chromosome partitioning protein ParB [Xanthomonas hortorum pv. hederae]PUF01388.1 PRTRC system ParB family protein [Xanthomonas hortorum pv. hederae]
MNLPLQPTLPIRQIVQGKNPREYFDPVKLAELEEGIREHGVIQPIIVRPLEDGRYEIVAGERRWRIAGRVFGESYKMPVVIRQISDAEAEALATVENHHRDDMSAAEEAKAAQRLLMRNKADKAETARMLGWTHTMLERRLALNACTPEVLTALTERRIQLGHAELLSGVPQDKQDSVLQAVIAGNVQVATLKAQLGRYARRLADAIFDTAQCNGCPHNSARQAGLFAESLGEGYCQHPTHFEELTLAAVEAKATTLRDEYPTIRIVQVNDGFVPLPVGAEGDLGVGEAQYSACQGCQSFGCAVSAIPGSYGEVTRSLCFDAACNTRKVAAWRKEQRQAAGEGASATAAQSGPGGKRGKAKTTAKAKPTNQTPQRVVDYRTRLWRKWLAHALMADAERNPKVLVALALSSRASDVRAAEFGKLVGRLAGGDSGRSFGLEEGLRRADTIDGALMGRIVQGVVASAAFGVDVHHLEALLNYMEVDEARYFKWDSAFLDLFTMSELASLALETGLAEAMGARFKAARAKKKGDFIAALLSAKGFAYPVPAVMRYARRSLADAAGEREDEGPPQEMGDAGEEEARREEDEEVVA